MRTGRKDEVRADHPNERIAWGTHTHTLISRTLFFNGLWCRTACHPSWPFRRFPTQFNRQAQWHAKRRKTTSEEHQQEGRSAQDACSQLASCDLFVWPGCRCIRAALLRESPRAVARTHEGKAWALGWVAGRLKGEDEQGNASKRRVGRRTEAAEVLVR